MPEKSPTNSIGAVEPTKGSGHSSVASSIGNFVGSVVTNMAELPVRAVNEAANLAKTTANVVGSVASKVADATGIHDPKDSYVGGQHREDESEGAGQSDGQDVINAWSIGNGGDGAAGAASNSPGDAAVEGVVAGAILGANDAESSAPASSTSTEGAAGGAGDPGSPSARPAEDRSETVAKTKKETPEELWNKMDEKRSDFGKAVKDLPGNQEGQVADLWDQVCKDVESGKVPKEGRDLEFVHRLDAWCEKGLKENPNDEGLKNTQKTARDFADADTELLKATDPQTLADTKQQWLGQAIKDLPDRQNANIGRIKDGVEKDVKSGKVDPSLENAEFAKRSMEYVNVELALRPNSPDAEALKKVFQYASEYADADLACLNAKD